MWKWKWKYRLPTRTVRPLSIQSRGQPIAEEELFHYRNGRFLVNEEYELAKRYAPFNVAGLCQLIASLPAVNAPVTRIDKKEGGYNKALVVTAENGKKVIVKIPCPNIVPRQYGTAAEVAVLKLVKTRSPTPVSDVLAWSASTANPLQSEYIVLEQSTGIQLTDLWDQLKEADRVRLIRGFAQLESKLAAIEFPGYGALYLRDALPATLRRHPNRTIAVDETYCLGPVYHGSWPGGYAADPEDYAEYAGPWRTLTELGLGLADQGIFQINHHKTSYGGRGPHFGDPAEHKRILSMTKRLVPMLARSPTLQRHAQAVLCHPDFHPGNIFVSDSDPTTIAGVIDWQFTTIMPRFTQVRWPMFLNPPENYQTGTASPELPPDFSRAQQQQQQQPEDEEEEGAGRRLVSAKEERDQALLTKCYEAALLKSHLESYLALTETDVAVRQLFTSCPYTYREGIVPLRDCLVRLYLHWDRLGVEEECPVGFTRAEIESHEKELDEYRAWLKLRQHMNDMLQTNDGGWLPPHVDFEAAQKRHEKLYEHFIRNKTREMSESEARKLWFFRDRG